MDMLHAIARAAATPALVKRCHELQLLWRCWCCPQAPQLVLLASCLSPGGHFSLTVFAAACYARCGVLLFPAMALAKVYVGNLPATIPESAVEREFERFGRCRVWVARKPPGFGEPQAWQQQHMPHAHALAGAALHDARLMHHVPLHCSWTWLHCRCSNVVPLDPKSAPTSCAQPKTAACCASSVVLICTDVCHCHLGRCV